MTGERESMEIIEEGDTRAGGRIQLCLQGRRGCGYRTGKLTHPQTKAGPSINKNRPIPRLFAIELNQN